MKSFLGDKSRGRGLANNNPGFIIKTSIAWQGKIEPSTDNLYEQFQELRYGLRALIWQIYKDTIERKLNLQEFIKKYSGRDDGNPKLLSFVSSKTGILPTSYVSATENELIAITKALVTYFNADAHLITDEDYKDAYKLLVIKVKEKEEPVIPKPKQSGATFWLSLALLGGAIFSA